MHKSLVMGIIGTCLAVVFGIGIILLGIWMGSLFSSDFFPGGMPARMLSSMVTIYIVIGSVAAASAIPGAIACVLFKKQRHTSGVLFIVAAALGLLSAFVPGVLLLLAGIFALSKDKSAAPPLMAVPPPFPPYGAQPVPPPFPPYGAQPVPPPYPPYGAQPVPPPFPPYGAQPAPPPPFPPYGAQPAPPPPYPPYGAQPAPPPPSPSDAESKEQ